MTSPAFIPDTETGALVLAGGRSYCRGGMKIDFLHEQYKLLAGLQTHA